MNLISFSDPFTANNFRLGDRVSVSGDVDQIVVYVGCLNLGLAPATWWRRLYWWLRIRAPFVGR